MEIFWESAAGQRIPPAPAGPLSREQRAGFKSKGPVSSAVRAEITVNGERRVLAEDPAPGTLTGEMAEFAGQLHRKDRSSCREMMKHTVMMMEVLENAAGQRGSLAAADFLTEQEKE